ncbi:hypothetical protein [Deinococcus navajonensis]|uniref:SPW repeat-containing protein n=1 Tax=Deinococcus navajonensis TaxID=309884 RepID=A0ABV8XJJ6_9DEIO
MSMLTRRGLTPRAHGLVDYVACAAMLALPGALKLSPQARLASQAFALSYLGVSALTDYPYSLKRALPFPWHGRIELLTVPVLALTPTLLGLKAEQDHRYFEGLTLMVLSAYLATDWKADPNA